MLIKIFKHLDEIISSIFFGVFAFAIFIQVLNRYFFQLPMEWIEELASLLFIYSTYIGFSIASRDDAHLKVTFLKNKSGRNLQKILVIIVNFLILALSIYCFVYGKDMLLRIFKGGEKTYMLEIPLYFLYLPILLGLGLMGIRSILKLIQIRKEIF